MQEQDEEGSNQDVKEEQEDNVCCWVRLSQLHPSLNLVITIQI